jgi:hypothetical protein
MTIKIQDYSKTHDDSKKYRILVKRHYGSKKYRIIVKI